MYGRVLCCERGEGWRRGIRMFPSALLFDICLLASVGFLTDLALVIRQSQPGCLVLSRALENGVFPAKDRYIHFIYLDIEGTDSAIQVQSIQNARHHTYRRRSSQSPSAQAAESKQKHFNLIHSFRSFYRHHRRLAVNKAL
jgi:hypothetical protein